MKLERVVFVMVSSLLAGCTTVTPTTADFSDRNLECCLCRELAHGGMLVLKSDNDEWLCVCESSVTYGFEGDKIPKLTLKHKACESGHGCALERTGGGRMGHFYLWRQHDGSIELGRLDDRNAFPPIIFNSAHK